jgi:hypothetical protein
MKLKFLTLLFFGLLFSCQNEEVKQKAAQLKDAKKKEAVFVTINSGWVFTNPMLNPTSNAIVSNWGELRLFVTELTQKPKSSIGAFQKKAKILSKKASELNNNIPLKFAKPEIITRISVLTTKINSLNLFINLRDIPDKKVVVLVSEINAEMVSLYGQMDEIVRKSEIPREAGEPDFVMMKDTSRAIRSRQEINNIPKIE